MITDITKAIFRKIFVDIFTPVNALRSKSLPAIKNELLTKYNPGNPKVQIRNFLLFFNFLHNTFSYCASLYVLVPPLLVISRGFRSAFASYFIYPLLTLRYPTEDDSSMSRNVLGQRRKFCSSDVSA